MSVTKRRILVPPSQNEHDNCFICHTYLGPFKNSLNTPVDDGEKTIAEQLEPLLATHISRKSKRRSAICQDCFHQLTRYNDLQRESAEIQQNLYNLYRADPHGLGQMVTVKVEEPSDTESHMKMSCQKCRKSFANLREMALHTSCDRRRRRKCASSESDFEAEMLQEREEARHKKKKKREKTRVVLLNAPRKSLNAKISPKMQNWADAKGIKYDIEAFHRAFGEKLSTRRDEADEDSVPKRAGKSKKPRDDVDEDGISKRFIAMLKSDGIAYDLAAFQRAFGFTDSADYQRKLHQFGSGESQTVKCSHCPETFTSRRQFVQHMRTHKSREFYCDECDKEFRTKVCLVIHNATDHERQRVGPFECPICFKTYSDRTALRTHYHIHVGERTYLCGICGADFYHRRSFAMHSMRHGDVRPFTCDICRKGFRTKVALEIHVRVHTGEKKFECPHCPGRRFAQKWGRDLHIKKTHMHLVKAFNEACPICGIKLESKSKLRQHLVNAHEVADRVDGEGGAGYERTH